MCAYLHAQLGISSPIPGAVTLLLMWAAQLLALPPTRMPVLFPKRVWEMKDGVPHICVFLQNWQEQEEKQSSKLKCIKRLLNANHWHAASTASSDHHEHLLYTNHCHGSTASPSDRCERHYDSFCLLWDSDVQQACSVAGLRDRRFGVNICTQLFFSCNFPQPCQICFHSRVARVKYELGLPFLI